MNIIYILLSGKHVPRYSLQEEVVDLLPDERPQPQELAVDSVQHGLEEVTLAGVLNLKGENHE